MQRKRRLKEIDSDDNMNDMEPPTKRKKSSRIAKQQQEQEEEEKNMFDLKYIEHETIAGIIPSDVSTIKGSSKIAAFDMDWTIIKPKGKKKFPQNRKDWEWMFNGDPVTKKLKQLNSDGYQIVIFSNQNGIGSGKQSLDSVAGKIIDLGEKV